MNTRIITILIAVVVFTTGLMMGFEDPVFAGDPVEGMDITIKQNPGGRVSDTIYDSSFSNKTIGQVRMEVGDILLGYGFGGEYINQVTEALEGNGVYEAELKSFLLAIGMNEQDTQNILLEFDKLGISKDDAERIPPIVIGDAVSTPGTGDVSPSASEGTVKDILPNKQAEPVPAATTPNTGDAARDLIRQELHRPPAALIEDLKAAESKEQRENITKELKYRRVLLQQGVQTLRQDLRENAEDLRDNFRENIKTTIGHVDHGKTARIAVAHGKGLRMINRYRSAIARFDHILVRLESRIEKIENEAQARSTGTLKEILPSAILLIEEAKNTQTINKAKMVELEAKYESLLTGENPQGVAEEAREIAKELKAEIEKLHGLLDDIRQAATDYNSSISNSSSTL